MIKIYSLIILLFLFCIDLYAQFKIPRILKHTNPIQIQNLYALNSPFRETNVCVSPDGQYIFFMSLRGGQTWSKQRLQGRNVVYDGDIWRAKKTNGQWEYPVVLGENINTYDGEDEPNISPDGQNVVFQSWGKNWETTNGPYYQSTLTGTQWGSAVGLGGGINQFFNYLAITDSKDMAIMSGLKDNNYATDGATLSADGKIFIVAVGQYTGKMDLYISRKNEQNIWSYPKRLPVSTMGNERSPFLASDNKTLYFASDGYAGWGGLDIHKTTLNIDDSCGEVINVGSPFNTWQDDYGLILTASGNEAYFVREGDIYFTNTKNANVELKPNEPTLMLSGKIILKKSQKPTQATIKIIDKDTDKIIVETKNNALTGEYAIVIPNTTKQIEIEITKIKYKKENEEVNIPNLSQGLNKIDTHFYLLTEEEQLAEIPKENAASFGEETRLK